MGIPPVEPCTLAVSGHKEDNLLVSIYCPPGQFMNGRQRLADLQCRCRSRRALLGLRHRIHHHHLGYSLIRVPPSVR